MRWIVLIFVGLLAVGCAPSYEQETVRRSEQLLQEKRYNQALEVLQQGLRQSTGNLDLLRQQVRFFLVTGQADFAVTAYRELEKVSKNDGILKKATDDKNATVRQTAIKTLGLLRDPELFRYLSRSADDSEREVRQAAVLALGDLKDKRAVKLLTTRLKDSAWQVRAEAAQALGKIGDSSVVPILFELVEDEDAFVRGNAIKALRSLIHPDHLQRYTDALKHQRPEVKLMAAMALASQNNSAGMSVLLESFSSAGVPEQIMILESVATLKHRESIPKLRQLALTSPHASVKAQAILSLARLEDKESIPMLSELVKDESAPSVVRMAAGQALQVLSRL